jgi:hypothetical protein
MLSKVVRPTAAFFLVATVALQSPAASFASSSTTFSGQATGLKASVAGTPITLSDTGPLPSSGGAGQTSLLNASIPGVGSAEVLHASTIGQGDRSRSEASLANLSLSVGGNTVTADFLMSQAMAVCSTGGASTSGSSEVIGLAVNGQRIVVSGSPNQTVTLPANAGSIIINEQSTSPGSITVNALHVKAAGVADVVVASAHADISCPPPGQVGCSGQDFVTGGGWIEPGAAKDNFAVAGGVKNGKLWGHLEYHDHSAGGPTVHGTGVTLYTAPVAGSHLRHIEGTAEVNGQSGFTYAVDVIDNGNPGNNDVFSLKLSNGYTAGPSNLGGGNIQLHKPCE